MQYAMKLAALAATAVTIVSGSPVVKRQTAITDVQILNYALTLEHLEDKFYREGLANYTQADFVAAGFADPFYANLQEVAADEATHVSFLTTALGSAAVAECVYQFPSTDAKSFVGLSSVLEGVGVSAYLGAAQFITNKDYLTAAGSILTVEARHNAYIRSSLAQSPFPSPFDTPLGFNEVYTLAAAFIKSCPASNGALPFKAFPALALGTTGTIKSGSTVTVTSAGVDLVGGQLYAAFPTVTGPLFTEATRTSASTYSFKIPEGVNGQVYAVLTSCNTYVNDSVILAGPAIIEVTN